MIEAPPIFESWSLETFQLPRRSHLYALSPAGLATDAIESLTSYLTRLAEAHRVSVRTLLDEKILLLLKPPRTFKYEIQSSQSWLAATPEVAKAVECIRRLTLQQDLQNLTLLPWQHQLSTSFVFHNVQPFCPACFEEARNTDAAVYEPLLWALEAVKVCLRHRRYLHFWCTYCGRKQPFLKLDARPEHCAHCGSWLGLELPPFISTKPEELDWHINLAQMLGQRLESAWLRTNQSLSKAKRAKQAQKQSLMSLLESRYELDEMELVH